MRRRSLLADPLLKTPPVYAARLSLQAGGALFCFRCIIHARVAFTLYLRQISPEEYPVVNVDNLAKRQLLPHFIRVMPNEDWEVRDWAAFFGCTEDRLRIAAKAAGPLTKHVHAFLIRMNWIEQSRV